MMEIEVFGRSEPMAAVASSLDALEGVSRARCVDAARSGHSVVVARVRPSRVDSVLAELEYLDVAEDEISVTRLEPIEWSSRQRTEAGFVWSDVLGQAWLNSRPIGRYLMFMFVAGIIACYGVLDSNTILIIGAMAVSPDLLPITAIGVGLVGLRLKLAGEALATLTLGLAVTSATAALLTFLLDQIDLLPSGFSLDFPSLVLRGLASVSDETIAVAFVAGMAGMLALETRASSAVGVGVSVTTIPAAAYLGVAAGLGQADTALGALGVLGANVAMMVLGAAITLWVQRRFRRRATDRAGKPPPAKISPPEADPDEAPLR